MTGEIFMTLEQREQAENYAIAMGWSRESAKAASDDRLQRLMDSIAEECAIWGCD